MLQPLFHDNYPEICYDFDLPDGLRVNLRYARLGRSL
jgi:hypothetical protein